MHFRTIVYENNVVENGGSVGHIKRKTSQQRFIFELKFSVLRNRHILSQLQFEHKLREQCTNKVKTQQKLSRNGI